ncbi:chloramphenicol-sensitive protein RarD [Pseudomonas duriflava]|uniref:Chloramphenicol-sensitive protein RarD n=1 Tax=Pseudomonas duriflava TaxID=459528 RepID=A0A562QJ25_9PSED|nr:EamA family transporter RarD [Pseudomonas duriflava]TWI56739.1 chloramphenicol-sensitive protein RarD [Pseudomonas duriflava]
MSSSPRQGYILGLSAYVLWGLFPLYFKLLATLPALEILVQRIVWSALAGTLMLTFWKHPGWWANLRAHPRHIAQLGLTGLLVGGNWLIYIWAVNNGHMLEASLGYYINPLINVLLGLVLLGERLRPLQWLAVAIAAIGVVQQVWTLGQLPWVSLALAFSFAFYGLLRKRTPVAALPGMVVETWLLLPLAIIALPLLTQAVSLESAVWSSPLALLLVLSGPVTLIPLLCFNAAARKLPYSTIGFLQYIAPTLVLLLAVFVFHEPFPQERLLAFLCIWVALLIFSVDIALSLRRSGARFSVTR